MKKFFEKHIEVILFPGIVILLITLICGMGACVEYAQKKKEVEVLNKKKGMTEGEAILFDANQETCGKRNGSTPSCWTDADWDLFFYKYCQRIKCE